MDQFYPIFSLNGEISNHFKLPLDVWHYTFRKYMSPLEITRVSGTCKYWHNLCSNNIIWKDICHNTMQVDKEDLIWKHKYIANFQRKEISQDLTQMTISTFDKSCFMIKADAKDAKYMSISLIFSGEAKPKEISSIIKVIKEKSIIQFVDWSPTGFKVGFNNNIGKFLQYFSNENVREISRIYASYQELGCWIS